MKVKLTIVSSNQINAGSRPGEVIITTSMLKFLDNKDQLALVLGHEFAHIVHHDMPGSTKSESRADIYGFFLAKKAGYNVCRGAAIFLKFAKYFGNNNTDYHPKDLDRYNNLIRYCR